MKVLVTGSGGQLGVDVMKELRKRGHECVGLDRSANDKELKHIEVDITNLNDVLAAVRSERPDAIIHCAAWTNVDAAEDAENRDAVFAVNADGTRNVAIAARDVKAKMLYISTDYVFDGSGDAPWQADNRDYSPLNTYGESKLLGEKAVVDVLDNYYIVRIAWVFGSNGKNFVNTMIDVGKKNGVVRVVDDQIGTPTYTVDLARLLVDMIETDKYGYYHATNEGGFISWADFAEEIYKDAGMDTKVERVSTEEYGLSKARRPRNSRLDKTKLSEYGFSPLPTWDDALKRYISQLHF